MSDSDLVQADLVARFHRLRDLLAAHDHLWRPAPFHEPRPAWCDRHPDLAGHLLGLEDDRVEALAADNGALIDLIGRFIPPLMALRPLIDLPSVSGHGGQGTSRESSHVPGRKQAQIEAFAACLGEIAAPVLEWCAGKGHLGRLLGGRRRHVLSLELDGALCAEGERLAAKAGVAQTFLTGDALATASARHLAGHHAVALHACGDLHLALLSGVVRHRVPGVDLAPCCYDRIATSHYRPLNPDAGLALSRQELHLAVTDSVTAGAHDRRQRDRAQAWKLAFLELRAAAGVPRGGTFKPVPAAWYRLGFAEWMRRLADREAVPLPESPDWPAWEAEGRARRRQVVRLELARLAFRRPLEVWLALDRALFLARRGYRVSLTEFCARGVTPRNLLISARLATQA